MRLRHARCQSDGRQPVSSLALSLVSLPAHPTRDHPAASIDATSHVHAQRHVPLRRPCGRERRERDRTSALPAHVTRIARTRAERCHAACTRRVCPALVRVLSGYAEGSLSGAGWRQPPPVPTLQVPYIPIRLSLLYHIHIPILYPTRGSCKGRRWLTSLQALVSP